MARIFDSILAKRPVRNWFPLGRDVKLSLDIGKLVPVMCEPVVPTDEGTIQTQSFVRFAPMLHPVLAQFNVRFDYFYVPMCRLYDYNLYNRIVTGGTKGNLDIPRFGSTIIDLFIPIAQNINKLPDGTTIQVTSMMNTFFGESIVSKQSFLGYLNITATGVNFRKVTNKSIISYFYIANWLYQHFFAVSSLGDYLNLPTPTYFHNGVEVACYSGSMRYYTTSDAQHSANTFYIVGGFVDDEVQMLYEFYKFLYHIKDYWINLEPFLAYQAIFADYYRDQNLDTAEFLPVKDSFAEDKSQQFDDYLLRLKESYFSDIVNSDTGITTSINLFQLRNRAYSKDYFTSALPSAQRGPQANLKLDVEGTAEFSINSMQFDQATINKNPTSGLSASTLHFGVASAPQSTSQVGYDPDKSQLEAGGSDRYINQITALEGVELKNSGSRTTDLTGKVSGLFANLTAQALRAVVKLQEQLELLSTAGGRATEQIYAIFGKRPSDIMNKRVQYLGGSKSPVQITEVLADAETTSDEGTVPLGAMAGHGINSNTSQKIKFYCPDYGFIICLMSVMPKASYYQGIPRKFLQIDRFDFFLPKFEHLGEQAILNSELYAQHSNPKGTFGYTPRYAEYKSAQDEIHGQFRTSLRDWHAARSFCGTNPALTSSFISATQSDVDRIFTVVEDSATEDGQEGTQHVMAELYHELNMIRPMSLYSTPSF